jgi:hypothetical protein
LFFSNRQIRANSSALYSTVDTACSEENTTATALPSILPKFR